MAWSYNNLRTLASISGAWYRVMGGTYTSLTTAATATDIFTDTGLAVNDFVAFRTANYCPKIKGLRISIATALTGVGITGVWEYLTTSNTWSALAGVTDGTNGFTTAGANLDVTWTIPADIGTSGAAINALVGSMWVRYRITAITSYTEGGRTSAVAVNVYDNTISSASGDEYDFGTATSGTTNVINDTTKAWTVNALKNRIAYVHTGTNAGIALRIKTNTATQSVFYDLFDAAIDNTSQYSICLNFEDIYQADVAAGWGLVTKAGEHSYAFNCYLDFKNCSFGDINANVEFPSDYCFFSTVAHSSRNRMYLGWRLPLVFGLDKSVWGNSFIFNRTFPMDNRQVGFTINSKYVFTAGNRYVLRHDYRDETLVYLCAWFNHKGATSIDEYFEGWRSVLWNETSTPKTEVRAPRVVFGHSGVEQPFANISGLKSYFNNGLALFLTQWSGSTFIHDDFELGLNTRDGFARYGNPIQYYSMQGVEHLVNQKGIVSRPMNDPWALSGAGETYKDAKIRIRVKDGLNENDISNARVVGINTLGTVLFDTLTGTPGEFLSGQAVTSPNSYTITTQPTAATKLRMVVSNYTKLGSPLSIAFNANCTITGTDANGTVIQEFLFLEKFGNGEYFTLNEFFTVTSIAVLNWNGTISLDRAGVIYPQTFTVEKWIATDFTNLELTEYNPITIKVSKPGFETTVINEYIKESKDWNIALKRSKLVIQ